MRWNLISADGGRLPFHQQGNQVSFKWKSSWNLFIPKFAANIPEETLPSKRQCYWEKGPISDAVVIRYSRNFPHPHFLLTPSYLVLANVKKNGSLPTNVLNAVPCAGSTTGECQPPWPLCPGSTQAHLGKGRASQPAALSWLLIAMSCLCSQAVRKLVWVERMKAASSTVSMEATYDASCSVQSWISKEVTFYRYLTAEK